LLDAQTSVKSRLILRERLRIRRGSFKAKSYQISETQTCLFIEEEGRAELQFSHF